MSRGKQRKVKEGIGTPGESRAGIRWVAVGRARQGEGEGRLGGKVKGRVRQGYMRGLGELSVFRLRRGSARGKAERRGWMDEAEAGEGGKEVT